MKPQKKPSMTSRLIALIEKLSERALVAERRCEALENRVALIDGRDDAAAALTAAQRQVKVYLIARGLGEKP
jgi:hypothetical protein